MVLFIINNHSNGENIMKKITAALALSLTALSANAANMASITLSNFVQNGSVTNDAASSANITSIVYNLGTPRNGGATWDSNFGDTLSTGVASNFLSDNRWFQTITFNGLNVAAGTTLIFSRTVNGLDIDLIETLAPLSVSNLTLDEIGSSLVGASMTVFWSNGDSASANLAATPWRQSQELNFRAATSSVPVPAAAWLFATGLAGFAGFRRKS